MERNQTPPNLTIKTILFNPFIFIAGGKALLIGTAIIVLSGVICYAGNCHFDGLLDVHFGSINRSPIWIYLCEGCINWLVIAVLITVSSRLITRSRFRLVDIFGTLALARTPLLITALIALIPGVQRYAQYSGCKALNIPTTLTPTPLDSYLFYAATFIMIIVIIWTVVLMYRAFSVACNAGGKKSVVYFIVIVLLGEILSKLAIVAIGRFGSGAQNAFKGLA